MRPPHQYVAAGVAAGHAIEFVERAASYRTEISESGAVPVLTLFDLARQTEASYGYLRRIVQRSSDDYTLIKRLKRDGGVRTISAPKEALMGIQRWVLENCLDSLDHHDSSYAYRRGRSIAACAKRHLGATWLVKLDLHNFFGGIEENRVFEVFRSIGYPPLLSFELARICTRVHRTGTPIQYGSQGSRVYPAAPPGVLPQGAPTSGAIANAVATPLDRRLADVARSRGAVYTRYSDDLTFSLGGRKTRRDASRLIAEAAIAIEAEGFLVHRAKTRVVPPGSRKVVLGLLLTDDGVRLRPEFRRQLQVHLRGAWVFGLVEHSAHRGFASVLSFINYVDGCIAFALDVESEWAQVQKAQWAATLRREGFLSPSS